MRSPISVAALAALILLLPCAEAAQAARPKVSTTKKALIDAELRKSGFANIVRDNAEDYVREKLQKDPRTSNVEPAFYAEFAKALIESVDAEAIRRFAFDHWDQAFTERELKAISDFYRSKAGVKLLTVGNKMFDDTRQKVLSAFDANYERVLRARLREMPPPVVAAASPSPSAEPTPSPTPSPSLVAEPSRRPSPKASDVEASWLTKTIWKWFPETNKCGS